MVGLPWPAVGIVVKQWWCGKPHDASGLASGSAPWVDAAMDAGILTDDSPLVVRSFALSWEQVKHKADAQVVIEIRRVE